MILTTTMYHGVHRSQILKFKVLKGICGLLLLNLMTVYQSTAFDDVFYKEENVC